VSGMGCVTFRSPCTECHSNISTHQFTCARFFVESYRYGSQNYFLHRTFPRTYTRNGHWPSLSQIHHIQLILITHSLLIRRYMDPAVDTKFLDKLTNKQDLYRHCNYVQHCPFSEAHLILTMLRGMLIFST
jgi:hypothetical protein